MQTHSDFQNFVSLFPNWEEDFAVYQRDDKVYKRIICRWDEVTTSTTQTLHHEYHACINTKTGDIFLDCSRGTIFAKHLTLALLRPIHTLIKTLWHLSIILPLSSELNKLRKREQTIKDVGINTLKSLADIPRTLFYGSVLTLTHIAAVIAGIVRPNTLYQTREIAGKLERKLLRVNHIKEANSWILSFCFSPMKNICKSKNNKVIRSEIEIEVKAKLRSFAKKNVEFLRESCLCFDAPFPKNKTYISEISPKK